tara:strand:+ start:435 stop:866 length:432 start_codon:yes stop_codon:yes gene_type:complete
MTSDNQENAMTEIALAMAMGFFSIMVLTSMSMVIQKVPKVVRTPQSIATTILIPQDEKNGPEGRLKENDQLVIFDGQNFLDRDLSRLDLSTLVREHRVILAVSQDLRMASILSAQDRLSTHQVVVTPLSDSWQRAIGGLQNEQ